MEGERGWKPFYCRDWAFDKLRACLDKRPASATCGTLVMGDSGCGKTAFCRELVWPSRAGPSQTDLGRRLLAYHFCSIVHSESLQTSHFLLSLNRQIANNDVIGDLFKEQLPPQPKTPLTTSCIVDPDDYLLTHVMKPLNALQPTQPNRTLYLLIDGLDECDSSGSTTTRSHTIPQLLSRHYRHFPNWLALVCSCSSKAKRVSRMFTGFRKLSLDDITRSHVVQDIQQYILHRLDADDSLRRHLNKDTAEILDKLHVKCNGCILYVELILDMVAQGSISLRQVRDIPATLGGLYMWVCQRLLPDSTCYQSIAKPTFNIILAARQPLSAQQVYDALITRADGVGFAEFMDCLTRLSHILLNVAEEAISFCHPSFRLWLQDVKFCSRTYLCDPRDGHELLTLYYTVMGGALVSEDVCDFAYHIQRCNTDTRSTSSSKSTTSSDQRYLSLHEQAVWMLLSQAQLSSPSSSVTASMVDSLMMQSSSVLDDDLSLQDLASAEQVDVTSSSFEPEVTDTSGYRAQGSEGAEHAAGFGIPDDAQSAAQLSRRATQPAPATTSQLSSSNNTGGGDTAPVPITCDELLPVDDCLDSKQSVYLEHERNVGLLVSDKRDAVDDFLADRCHEEDESDEVECLDEDVEDGEEGECDIDSELGSLDSGPAREGESPPRPAQQAIGSHTVGAGEAVGSGWEEALMRNDLQWLEEAIAAGGLEVNVANSEGRVPLVSASAMGQLEAVEMLILLAGAEVNLPDFEQKTALTTASWFGHDSIVSFLLNNDADVNRPDNDGHSPLLAACYMGHSSVVELLVSHGADVNAKHSDGRTALCVACSCPSGDQISSNNIEIVKLLIQSGCDVNVPDKSFQTPLHLASYEGNLEICNILLSSDAAVDAVDESQHTPLLCAVSMGHTKVVDLLLASGADVHHLDQDGRTSLSLACVAGYEDIVRLFLEMGQDEMHRDNYGVDCLHFSALEGHPKVAAMLLEYGANVNSQDDQGRTSLFLAAQQGELDVLTALVSHGADTNLSAHNGKSPLRIACTCEYMACTQCLIRYGAYVNYKDMEGRAIIYILALENRPECISLLVGNGADVNASDDQGRTALHVACWQGHVEVVDALLHHDIIIDAEDHERRTPLQSAAWQGHTRIAELLCAAGANVNHMCDQGATPLCIASQEGFMDVVSVLCDHGADPNHCDRFGRTALKIAMKANNEEMLHLIENIMRRYKPSNLTPDAARSGRSLNYDQSDSAVYENFANRSDLSAKSSVELVMPYAIISLPRDNTRISPKLIPHRQHSSAAERPHDLSSRGSASQLTSMEDGIRKLRLGQHSADSSIIDHRLAVQESQAQHGAAGVARPTATRQVGRRQRRHQLEDNSDSSEGCDTAPSTISSTADDGKSTQESAGSDSSSPRTSAEGLFTQQIVQLGRGAVPNFDNVDLILSGEVGHMANPRVNKALYAASQIAAGNVAPPTEPLSSSKSPVKNISAFIGLGKFRQNKQTSGKSTKMAAAVQNTARNPTYKVQYAAADHPPSLPASYSVRNDELMSAEHSLSSVKSRQAKIISSSGSRASADSASLNSSQEPSRYSPPPVLPPRAGRPSHPPLHCAGQGAKPTLVGVVRPRSQLAPTSRPVSDQQAGYGTVSPFRNGQKETSL